MRDEDKTKEQLINELSEMRKQIAELEALEKKRQDAEETYKIYTFITNTTKELMTLINRNYTYEVVNEPYYKTHNKARREIIGKKGADIWGEETFNTIIKGYIDQCFAGDNVHYQKQFHFGSEAKYFDVSYYPYYNDSGTVTHVVVVTRDITERKQTEEVIRESEQRYRQLFNSISDTVVIYNSHGRFLDCNEATLQRLGYSREEFLRLTPADIVHPDFHLIMPDNQKRVWAGETTMVESVHRCKDGRLIPVEVNSHRIDYQGEPALLAVARDITNRKQAREKLQESENRYRSLIDASPDAIISTDLNGNIVTANRQAALLHGFESVEEMLSSVKHFLDHIAEEDHERAIDGLKTCLETGVIRNVEHTFLRKDGTSFPAELSASLIVDAEGKPKALIAVTRDITERKRAEEALRESEEKFRLLIENTTDIVMRVDHDGMIQFINYVLPGLEKEDIVGKKIIYEFIPSEYHQRVRETLDNVFKTGNPGSYDIVGTGASGNIAYYYTSVGPFKSGEKVVSAILIARDVTERKKMEEALKLSEEKYRLIFENVKDGISIYEELKDGGRKLLECNPQYVEMSGYSLEELRQINDTQKIQVGHNTPQQEAVNIDSLLAGQPYKGTFSWIRSDGKENYVEYTATPLKIGSKQCVVGIDHDITEQKLTELELQKSNLRLSEVLTELKETQQRIIQQERLRALGQIASGIAHDFNNTLTPILGYADVMLTVPQILDNKEQTKTFLDMIRTAATDAKEMVKRLSEFYRHREDGEVFIPFNLNQLVQQVIELTQPKWRDQALAAGVTIRISTDLQEAPYISGNEVQLREVLTNLLFNAVDAMPDGGSITIRTYLNGDYVVLEISDTGVGMTEEIRRRCFEPFFSTKEKRGTGLRLSVVHGIIQRHNGIISVESELWKGTTFTIQLPIPTGEQAANKSKEVKATISSRHILLIEDDEMVRDLLTLCLTKLGHTVETATNGREGLEKFYQGKFDVVITDRAMPGMNGIQVAERLKQFMPNVPVIMLTGFGDIMVASDEMPDFVDCLVSKPVTLSKLREALAKMAIE